MLLRKSKSSDMSFLREMLYQSVYWRAIANQNPPPYTEALADPQVNKALADWRESAGDLGVVALHDSVPVGAAWYRFWTDENNIRGYIEQSTPSLVIAVHIDFRDRGIGKQMLEWLVEYAITQGIEKMSLMVAKDNKAIHLYRKCGFIVHADRGDSVLMLREI